MLAIDQHTVSQAQEPVPEPPLQAPFAAIGTMAPKDDGNAPTASEPDSKPHRKDVHLSQQYQRTGISFSDISKYTALPDQNLSQVDVLNCMEVRLLSAPARLGQIDGTNAVGSTFSVQKPNVEALMFEEPIP